MMQLSDSERGYSQEPRVKLELSAEKLRPVTINLIEMGDGMVIKRGRVEIKVAGEEAGKVLGMIFKAAQNGATREQLLDSFSPGGEPRP